MIRRILFLALFWLSALPAFAALDIREVVSPGGIRAWLVEALDVPFAALEIRFKGGTRLDLARKRGATVLMTSLRERGPADAGAADLDAQAFATRREALAASLSFDAHEDAVEVSARFLTENRGEAAALLKSALTEPRFDGEAIERVRAQILSIIQSNGKDPDHIAGDRFRALAFGDHPYGSSDMGTLDSVGGLGRDDIVAAWSNAIARDRLFVGAVGDISADELGLLLDELLGALPAQGAAMPAVTRPALTGGVTVVPFDSPQSVVVFGHEGIARDDRDFFAAFVLNQILGGSGFSSRLMDEVREKRGLTYGISSFLVTRDLANTWQGGFASANEKVAEAVRVIVDQWRAAAGGGITDAQLDAAKTYLTGAYPLRFDGNSRIASILAGMQ